MKDLDHHEYFNRIRERMLQNDYIVTYSEDVFGGFIDIKFPVAYFKYFKASFVAFGGQVTFSRATISTGLFGFTDTLSYEDIPADLHDMLKARVKAERQARYQERICDHKSKVSQSLTALQEFDN